MQQTKGVKMIVCHVCGTENPDGSKFCEGCGVELQAPVALNVGTIAPVVAAVAAPVIEAAAPVIEAAAPVIEAAAPVIEPVVEATAPVVEAAEAAIPGLAAPVIAPPPLPADEAALDLEATPAPVVEAPAAPVVEAPVEDVSPLATVIEAPAIAPAAMLSSTLDGTVNPKATIETPILSIPKIAKLIPRGSGGEGHLLHSERMVVGRFDPSAGPVDIDLSGGQGENYISRRHAEVYLEGDAWMVRDLGSTNGVYVKRAGQAQYSPRIIEPQVLFDGDEVAFGNMKFLFAMSEGA
jgi:FHA domain/zinc-ribbon domain